MYTHWQNRWHVLDAKTKALIKIADKPFKPLLKAFRAFADEQFHFFYDGFSGEAPYRLEPSTVYPAAYVFRIIINQIGYDLSTIERAMRDREHGDNPTLIAADYLGTKALQAVSEQGETAGLIRPTQTISYFKKSTKIRVIPYANSALIGIPYTASPKSQRDLLAIAHEVGHHIFWHGRHNGERLSVAMRQHLPDQPEWIHRWLEEIFADIIGCLIGGEVMALSSQAMIREHLPSTFTHDDADYAIDAIRPLIYTDTMRLVAETNGSLFDPYVINQLEDRWFFTMRERGNPTEFVPQGGSAVSLETARQHLRATTETILADFLAPYITPLRTAWVSPLRSFGAQKRSMTRLQTELDEMYAEFEEIPYGDFPIPEVSWQKPTPQWILTARQLLQGAGSIPVEVWHSILVADGWTSEGPQTDPVVG